MFAKTIVLIRRAGSRTKVGASFFGLALLLFGATAMVSGWVARAEAERASGAMLAQLASAVGARLDADVAERLREIRRLAELESTLGVELDRARWRVTLGQLQRAIPHYSWIGVADEQGRVEAATQGMLEGQNVGQRPWFQQGQREPAVLDVHDAKLLAPKLPLALNGEPPRFIDVAAPLYRRGTRVGVLGAHLNWDWAELRRREALTSLDPALKLEIVLVDRQSRIDLGPEQPALDGGRLPAQNLTRHAVVHTWTDGHDYLTAAQASQAAADYPGMGWTVVVRQPVAVAFEAANRLQRQLWVFSAFGAAAFGALGWWLAGVLTAPLRDVARRAQVQAPAPAARSGSHDEVQQVAESLGALIDGLRARERELREFNEHLEEQVQQRTQALQRANDDLRSFASSVSHDLRGPLGQIAALLRISLEQHGAEWPQAGRNNVEVVAAECERLRHLCEDMLALAQVQQRELQREPVNTNQLVDEVLAELRGQGAGATAQVVVAAPLPPVHADPVLLRQVWTNLVSNAFKYSSKVPQPRVAISAQPAGDEQVFTVADNGAGFDAAQAGRLFGAFQRLHRAQDFPGVGVGLSIVKRVVERHGGRVWAESSPGDGARFHFTLPMAAEDSSEATPVPRTP
jgi:signal transduction histidine kinase